MKGILGESRSCYALLLRGGNFALVLEPPPTLCAPPPPSSAAVKSCDIGGHTNSHKSEEGKESRYLANEYSAKKKRKHGKGKKRKSHDWKGVLEKPFPPVLLYWCLHQQRGKKAGNQKLFAPTHSAKKSGEDASQKNCYASTDIDLDAVFGLCFFLPLSQRMTKLWRRLLFLLGQGEEEHAGVLCWGQGKNLPFSLVSKKIQKFAKASQGECVARNVLYT